MWIIFWHYDFHKTRLKKEQFKVILTQDDCDTIPRNGYVGFGNVHVYFKPSNKVWEILMGAYDAKRTMVVDVLKEKKMPISLNLD